MVWGKLSLDVQRGSLSFETRICGDDHLANPTLRHTRYQSIDREVLGSDAVERRKSASENVIQASKLTGALDRADIRRFFDCADERGVTSLIAADRTQFLLRQVEAPRARPHAFGQRHERGSQSLTVLRGLTKEVVGEPERCLAADPRQTGELGSEVVYGRHDRFPVLLVARLKTEA